MMILKDLEFGIEVDDEFPCSSAGDMRILEPGKYEVGYQPEEIPQWFQDVLDELFDGAGVPKEYMAHVRVRNNSDRTRRVVIRFLLSRKGSNYMYPPWWIWRDQTGWEWLPPEDTDYHEHKEMNATLELNPGEWVRLASAPYEQPDAVLERTRRLAERSDVWSYREIGTSAQGRPLPVLESAPRDIKFLIDATMQSCEPVSWGILHVAHWLTIPTARARKLLDKIQFCIMPMLNPDGVYLGHSVTNSLGEVPKFGINRLVEGKGAPRETAALWEYLLDMKPDAGLEVHAHFTRDGFTRSIGMHDKDSMPEILKAKGTVLEQAIFENYHVEPLDNRKVLIDPREPEHNVYGDRYVSEQAGTIRTFLQAVPDSLESHGADVREMVETISEGLIKWKEQS
ncbi:MAG TPA: hypothetical protein DIU35_18405 [Candidatus Latescibacteria bacterium]|nr:hypothetical protein [Gemmatimonadota bacterium]HCR19455.1 hypothetical protein [Candidatus Latescibacterota bacterium]